MIRTRQLSGRAKSRYLRDAVEQAGAGPDVSAKLDGAIVSVLVKGAASGGLGVERPHGPRRMRRRVSNAPASCAPGPTPASPPAPDPPKAEKSPTAVQL